MSGDFKRKLHLRLANGKQGKTTYLFYLFLRVYMITPSFKEVTTAA